MLEVPERGWLGGRSRVPLPHEPGRRPALRRRPVAGGNAPDLWLRDGDVLEVPER